MPIAANEWSLSDDASFVDEMPRLGRGWQLERAAAWGVAAGSLNTRYVGATSHPPGLEEIEDLAKQVTIRIKR